MAQVPKRKKIAEDDPDWDCRTMGNKRCGPTPPERALRRKVDLQRYPSGQGDLDLRVPLRASEDGRGFGREYDGPPSRRVVKRRIGRVGGRR